MKKRGMYIVRQALILIFALQILNLSVGSQAPWDAAVYDYSYTYNKSYDPTESAIEWIVEINCGQQPGFSYNVHEDASKSPSKSLHWKTDLQQTTLEPAFLPVVRKQRVEIPASLILSRTRETFSPPPENNFV